MRHRNIRTVMSSALTGCSILLVALLLSSCTGKKQNTYLAEFLKTHEHDPALIGWWESVKDPDEMLFFDDTDFRQIKARPNSSDNTADDSDDSTDLYEYHWGWFWYTENGVLYSVKQASRTTEIYEVGVEYKVSEDGEFLLEKDHTGSFITTWKRK